MSSQRRHRQELALPRDSMKSNLDRVLIPLFATELQDKARTKPINSTDICPRSCTEHISTVTVLCHDSTRRADSDAKSCTLRELARSGTFQNMVIITHQDGCCAPEHALLMATHPRHTGFQQSRKQCSSSSTITDTICRYWPSQGIL